MIEIRISQMSKSRSDGFTIADLKALFDVAEKQGAPTNAFFCVGPDLSSGSSRASVSWTLVP